MKFLCSHVNRKTTYNPANSLWWYQSDWYHLNLPIFFGNCSFALGFSVWIYIIIGHILTCENCSMIQPQAMKDYEEYMALRPVRYSSLPGVALVHKDRGFFPGISMLPDLFWNDKHNLPQSTKQSTECSVQNPFVIWQTGFLQFAQALFLWLGVSELERAIENTSAVTEEMGNATVNTISALQSEVK